MSSLERLLAVAKLFAPFILASAYLGFCVVTHQRLIAFKPGKFYEFNNNHIAAIKAGVTSLSQLVIFAALYTVYDVVSMLKSEEFFRILRIRRMRGLPLAMLDKMSNPNYGSVASLKDVVSSPSSIYVSSALIATLIGMAISLVAPATLNVASVLVENKVVALTVGAVPPQSVYNASLPMSDLPGLLAGANSITAAYILWSEMMLGANYSFSVATSDAEFAAYIVPIPIDLPINASAHWLTDVIGLNPSCSWAWTNISTPTQPQANNSVSQAIDPSVGIYLENLDLDVVVIGDFRGGASFLNVLTLSNPSLVFNHSTHGPPTDGSTVFLISQCSTGCNDLVQSDPIVLDLTDIPTFVLDINVTTYETWEVALLACRPHAVVQTREIVSNGTGFLEVLPVPNGKQHVPQGNLNPTQTSVMLSFALNSILYAGAVNTTNLYAEAGGIQADFLFGREQIDGLPSATYSGPPVVLTILPTEALAPKFGAMLQSASKFYLAGYLGTAYVPARLFSPQIVLTSSMPFIIISTIMFGMLLILMAIMHFRSNGTPFTLVNVSASLHGSNLPSYFMRTERWQALEANDDYRVVLQKGEDGMDVLQILDDSGRPDIE